MVRTDQAGASSSGAGGEASAWQKDHIGMTQQGFVFFDGGSYSLGPESLIQPEGVGGVMDGRESSSNVDAAQQEAEAAHADSQVRQEGFPGQVHQGVSSSSTVLFLLLCVRSRPHGQHVSYSVKQQTREGCLSRERGVGVGKGPCILLGALAGI